MFSSLFSKLRGSLVAILLAGQVVNGALTVDIKDQNSLKSAASAAAQTMMTYYHANESGQIPGKLPGTWWEGGALFMTLIQYWHFTGDTSFNPTVTQGMLWQAGENADYMPSNWSSYLGNDDQLFWALAAMTAAELKYPEGPSGSPSWLSLAQAVFNEQVGRWDTTNCNGGLRWQLFQYQGGYTIKNAISNGGLAQLGARLARYTSNNTYADWVEKIWQWSATTPLMIESNWTVMDTTLIDVNCQGGDQLQWTYNYGTYLMAAAYMWNYTNGNTTWQTRLDGVMNTSFMIFFPTDYGGNIMSEVACESNQMCNQNQVTFKAFYSSWLAFTTALVPYTAAQILPKLQASAVGAASQCSGGNDGIHCGRRWYQNTWDGTSGLEEQMSAVSIFASNLIASQSGLVAQPGSGPVTANTGGNSTSNPNAGTAAKNTTTPSLAVVKPITTGDIAGAGVLTAVFAIAFVPMMVWICLD